MSNVVIVGRHAAPRQPGISKARGFIALVAITVIVMASFFATTAHAAGVYYVSPTGSDSNSGSASAPFHTLKKAFTTLRAGDKLYVRGGTYTEQVTGVSVAAGTASAPIVVQNYPGERPVLSGLLWLSNPSYWTFDGLNITWSSADTADEHMVKMTGGTGWRITNAEIWGAHSWANILVAGDPDKWSIDHSSIHDNYGSSTHNGVQDHDIYVNTTLSGHSGVIEDDLIYNATRGEIVKLDGTGTGSGGGMNVTVRYNTMVNSSRSMLLGGQTQGSNIYRNLVVTGSSGSDIAIYLYNNTGSNNSVHDNLFWDYKTFLNVSGSTAGFSETNNLKDTVNPQLDGSLKPQNSAAAAFGYYAGSTTSGGTTTSPSPSPTPTSTATPTASPTASPTSSPTSSPSTSTSAAAGSISYIGASSGANGTATTLSIGRPAGAVAGDVLVAGLAVRGQPTITAPAGWAQIRQDAGGSTLRSATYWHVVGASEPSAYVWTFSSAQGAAGSVLDYRGVRTSSPAETSAGQVNASAISIAAPSVSTATAGDIVVGVFATATQTSVAPAAGMTERGESATTAGTYRITVELADMVPAGTGVVGSRSASAGTSAVNIGSLVAISG